MEMHHRHDDNLIGVNSKHDPEREGPRQATTNITVNNGIQEWVDLDSVQRILNHRQETLT